MIPGHSQSAPLSFKIILLGDSDVGKTTFIKQYIDHTFAQRTKPTCSVDFAVKKCQIDNFMVKLNIFDTAGQERFKSLTRSYVKGTDAVLFLYDMSKKQSFDHVEEWVKFLQRESENNSEIKVLVGTKSDLTEGGEEERRLTSAVEKSQVKQFVQKYHFTFKFQTSAKKNRNIDLVFEQLSRNLIFNFLKKKKTSNPIKEQDWSIILKKDRESLRREEEDQGGCC